MAIFFSISPSCIWQQMLRICFEQRQMKINRPSLTRFLTTHFFHYFGFMYHHRREAGSRGVERGEYLGYKARTEDRELPQLSHPLFHHLRTYSRHCLFLQNPRDEASSRVRDRRRRQFAKSTQVKLDQFAFD